MEIYKDIEGYEGLYQISNLGRVKRLERFSLNNKKLKEKYLKNTLDNRYYRVGLSKESKSKIFNVHQLVAVAFLNHVIDGHNIVVDHIDNNPLNNSFENLQLVTSRYNSSKDKKGYSSRYTGVSWAKNSKKWRVRLMINGKNKHIGLFTNEHEAHLAYQNALTLF